MKIENENISIPEGNFEVEVLKFDETDRSTLFEIYQNWRNLSEKLIKVGARGVNLPEGLSETSFCLEMGCWRITTSIRGANTSFDCYNPKTNERIQVKACSVLPDLTSFGPKSVWDKLYFVDFCKEQKWDGSFDIYEISPNDIYNQKVNTTQTVKDQQLQGRRPRFSIYDKVIIKQNLNPVKTGYLNK